MVKKFPIKPANPARICWGCDRYCPAESLLCGNGSVATPHPAELFGDDWLDWGQLANADRNPSGLFVTATETIQPTTVSADAQAAPRTASDRPGLSATTPKAM
jgi:hypothetical protein